MTKELAPINTTTLPVRAQQLQVVIDVDPDRLRHEVEAYTVGSASLRLQIEALRVDDEDSQRTCVALRNDAGRREKALTAIWKRFKDPLNSARAEVLRLEDDTVDFFAKLKDEANRKLNEYTKAQLRAKREAEAAMAKLAAKDRHEYQVRAEDLYAQGFVKQAQEVERSATMIMVPTLPDAVDKVEGNRTIVSYKGTCTEPMALLRAIVNGQFPLEHEVRPGQMRPIVTVDPVVVNAIVKRQLGSTRIPGVTVEEDVASSATRL